MNANVRFLCDHEGVRILAELPYSEYMKLTDASREAPLLRAKLKQISDVLGGAPLSVAETPPERGVEKTVRAAAVEAPAPTAIRKEAEVSLKPDVEKAVKPVAVEAPAPVPAAQKKIVAPASTGPAASVPPPEKPPAIDWDVAPKEERAVPVPQMLLTFLNEKDPSQNSVRLIEACARKLSGISGKRITLSLHKPYICLWDFDEWKTFAFGEVINGCLYLSIERSLVPNAGAADIWTPPSGLCKKPLARLKVDAITDKLLIQLKHALACTA
jgi:hypothetical protein